MDLSVIIPTWNNSKQLTLTLEALASCSVSLGMSWELILVNNNCTDDTDRVVSLFRKRLPLLYLQEPIQGGDYARNTGIQAAQGKLALFTDDDILPDSNWLAAYWTAYQEHPTGFYFGGPIESVFFEGVRPSIEILKNSMVPHSVKGLNWGNQSHRLYAGQWFIGPNWGAGLSEIKLAGGFDFKSNLDRYFDKAGVGGETDLMRRLRKNGLVGWYIADARVKQNVPAKKTTLQHIAKRIEAIGYVHILTYRRPAGRWSCCKAWILLVFQIIKSIVKCLGRFILKRKDAVDEYFNLRSLIGKAKAAWDLKN